MEGPQTITKTKTRTKAIIGWTLIGGAIVAAAGVGYVRVQDTAVIPPKPDLTILSLTKTPENLMVGDALILTAAIWNQGQATAPESGFRFQIINNNTSEVLTFYEDLVPSLTASNGLSVTTPASNEWSLPKGLSWIASPGSYKALVCIDPYAVLTESNEDNQCMELQLTVSEPPPTPQPAPPPSPPPPPPPPAPLADLTVLSLTRSPSSLTAGASVSFTATIKNQGAGPAYPFDVTCTIDVGNDLQVGNNPPPTVMYVPGIVAGGTANIACPAPWITTAGTHKAIVVVDAAPGVVAETNENNNSKNLVFTVAAPAQPDLAIQSFNCTPQNPTVGQNVTCTTGVKNQGTAPAGPSTTQFRIDQGVTSAHDQSTAALNVNSTAFKTLSWTATQGTHTFDVCADIANVVVESSIGETNNCSSPITVNVAAAPTASAPDLAVVQPIVYDPLYKKFTVTVVNQGTANTSSATLRFRIDKYKDGSWDFNPVTKSLGALAPNAVSAPQQWTWNVNFPGNHKAEACLTSVSPADPNSANNCQTLEFTM